MKYGERLKIARERAGITQQALAELVGMKQPSLAYLENPKNNAGGSEFTVKLAHALGVSVDWLDDEIGAMVAFEVAEATPLYAIELTPDDQQVLDTSDYLPPEKLNALIDNVRKRADEKRALLAALMAKQKTDEARDHTPPLPPSAPPSEPPRAKRGKPYKLPEPGIARPHAGHHKKRSA
jgi:transcriptional regulator with XRE-family HTH domain